MSIRFDSISIPKMTKTKEGYLRGEAVVSRSGVFKYRNADGSIRGELRHPDEIFHKDSLDTIKMIPITNNHPPEFVDVDNAHKYQVGYTGESYNVIDDKVVVSMTVTHKDAIDAITSGKLELSMGYSVNLEPENGIYKEEKYDFRQLAPKYNHLAIVEKGRAGSEARFRFDSASELIEEPIIIKQKKDNMSEEKKGESVDLKAENERLKKKIEGLEAKLQEQKKDNSYLILSNEMIEKKVIDRVDLLIKAEPFLKDVASYHKHSDREIMETSMNSIRNDNADLKKHSDEYIKGMFDSFVAANAQKKEPRHDSLFEVIKRDNHDAAHSDSLNVIVAKQVTGKFNKSYHGDK